MLARCARATVDFQHSGNGVVALRAGAADSHGWTMRKLPQIEDVFVHAKILRLGTVECKP